MKKLFAILSIALLAHSNVKGADKERDWNILTQQFERYAGKAMEDWETPGMSIAIVKDDRVIFAKGFGVKTRGGQDKVDSNTLFQIGSVSKSFTVALLAMLADQKKLEWNERVVDTLPSFMMYDPWVTREFQVIDTVAQRSGLGDHVLDVMSFIGYKRADIVHALRYVKPVSSFRSAYAYQNALFLVAAQVLEAKTGQSWEELIKERIFKPLEMQESSADAESYLKAKNVSWLHSRDSFGKTTTISKPFAYMNWVYEYGPAGGINSTSLDMAKYTIMQMNGGKYKGQQLISAENVKTMHRPQILAMQKESGDSYYCLGWVYTEYSPYPFNWHTGGTSGAGSIVAFIPEEKLGIVVLTNQVGGALPNALALQLFDMYYAKPDQDWSKQLLEEKKAMEKAFAENYPKIEKPFPPLPLEMYTGLYHDDALGEARIQIEGDQLVMLSGPNQVKTYLKHFNRDEFTIFWPEMDEEGSNRVSFVLDDKGVPSVMTAELFEKSGYGTYKRIDESKETK